MVQKKNANFKISLERLNLIDSLISAGTYDSRSHFYRVAVDEQLAKYTDIPTILALHRRLKTNKGLIDGLCESDRTQNRQIAENNGLIAEIKKELERLTQAEEDHS